jgi:hypothetical protein
MDREALIWALIFSVPVGVGLTGFAARIINEGILNPLAVAAGLTVAAFLFVVFAYSFSGGSPEEGHEENRAD